jgi:hypothetical protein
MKARLWMLIGALLMCFGIFALVVQADTAPKSQSDKEKAELEAARAQQAVMDQYLPVPPQTANSANASSTEKSALEDAERAQAQRVYARYMVTGEATPSEKDLMTRFIFSEQSRTTNPLDNSGGPDGFGYRFVDNVSPDTATYGWIELCDSATATNGPTGDDVSASATIGFTFPFYGSNYTTCYVTTNGVISFGGVVGGSGGYQAQDPAATTPSFPYVAPYWVDQNATSTFTNSGCAGTGAAPWIRWMTVGSGPDQRFVVEWRRMPEYSTGTLFSYEAILYLNGRVKVQYHATDFTLPTLTSRTWSAGIDAPGGTNGVRYWYYSSPNTLGIPPAAGRVIWYLPPSVFPHNFGCGGVTSPSSGNYQPSMTVPVTFTAENFGSTTESSPVKYRFNGGTIVTENTASLVQYGTEIHTFATQITVPATVGDYPLKVWTDVPSDADHSNDTCFVTVHVRLCADMTLNAPGTATGNTTGAGDDCNLRAGEDQIVQVNIPTDGSWTFNLCNSSQSWDSYIYLTTACCGGTTINFNDDGCAPLSKIACQPLTAGTYFLDIEPFSSGTSGAWQLDVTPCVPCSLSAQPGDITELTENPADTTFYRTDPDGGCNDSPTPHFGSISCGQTVFGRVFTYTGPGGVARADSDWYAITAATPESLIVDMDAEVPVRFGIVKYGNVTPCDTALLFINSLTTSDSCTHHVITSPECRAPGLYALLVLPTVTTGMATPREYRMSLNCLPCTVPVPPTNDSCQTATPITVLPNDSTYILGTTHLATVACTDTCDFTSSGPDVFYALSVTGCRLIEVRLEGSYNGTSGDMHVSVYAPGQCCSHPALLCDDDWGNFNATGLTWATHQPTAYSLSAWVADTLTTGIYTIRVGRFSTGNGPFSLVIYDDGGCSAACDSARNVTALRVDPTRADSCIEVRFDVTAAGSYEIWSTSDKNSAWMPGGVWALETTIAAPIGNSAWRDPAALQPFKRYVVSHNCP